MKSCAFISRHEPTPEQHALAARAGYELKCVGDADAFSKEELREKSRGYDAVCVVHPAAALLLCSIVRRVIVFRNENRAPVGEKPQFLATELHEFEVFPCQNGGEFPVVLTFQGVTKS